MQDANFKDGQASAAWALGAFAELVDPVQPFAEAVLPTLVCLLQGQGTAEGRGNAAWALSVLAESILPAHLQMPLASFAVHLVCQMLKVRPCSSTCRLMVSIATLPEHSSSIPRVQEDHLLDNQVQAARAVCHLARHADLRSLIADAALPHLASLLHTGTNTTLSDLALAAMSGLVDDDNLHGRVADTALQDLAAWLEVC